LLGTERGERLRLTYSVEKLLFLALWISPASQHTADNPQ
jgi:hypothetical protein